MFDSNKPETYKARVDANGIKTWAFVTANSLMEAKSMLQAQYGANNVLTNPVKE
jgi:hypothetical protein